MDHRYGDQQQRQQLLTIVDRGSTEQLFVSEDLEWKNSFVLLKTFLQEFHRRPFQHLADVMRYDGVIDDQIDLIDCTGTKYHVTPLITAAGKGSISLFYRKLFSLKDQLLGSYEKTKILLVHGANPNKQCATG